MWSMERGLVRDDFEDGVAVGDVQQSVGAEHETQQAAAPAVVVDAGHTGLGEVRAAQNNAANPDAAEVAKSRLSLSFMVTMLVPPAVPMRRSNSPRPHSLCRR